MADRTTALEEQLRTLTERLDEQQRELDELRSPSKPPGTSPISRRALLGMAGGGVAGAALIRGASPAAANTGDPIIIGQGNIQDTTSLTSLRYNPTTPPVGGGVLYLSMESATTAGNVLRADHGGTSGNALEGWNRGPTNFDPAVFGLHDGSGPAVTGYGRGSGDGVWGTSVAGIGVRASGGTAPLWLVPNGQSGPPTGGSYTAGELAVSDDGDLFFFDGLAWEKLNDQTHGPTFLAEPDRGYDSRVGRVPVDDDAGTKGAFAGAETRVIDLSAETGLVAGVSAALVNITVVGTTGAGGFVSVYSASRPTLAPPSFSNVNWFGPGQIIANTTATAVSPEGRVKVYASGVTDVIIDVIATYA